MTMRTAKKTQERIIYYREERGMSMRQVAAILGVSRTTVDKVMKRYGEGVLPGEEVEGESRDQWGFLDWPAIHEVMRQENLSIKEAWEALELEQDYSSFWRGYRRRYPKEKYPATFRAAKSSGYQRKKKPAKRPGKKRARENRKNP